MDNLDKYLKELDDSFLDHTNDTEIENNFQKLRDEFEKEGNNERAKLAQLEMEVVSFTKRVEDYQLKLSFRFGGTRKNEQGEEVSSEWPDINIYTDNCFDYIYKRFNSTKNDYLKTEYGFILLLAQKSKYKNDEIALTVLDSLINLYNKYLTKINEDVNDAKHYSIFFEIVTQQAFILANLRQKNNKAFKEKLNKVKNFIFETITSWNVQNKSSRVIVSFSKLIMNHSKEFKSFKLERILDKLWELSQFLIKTYIYGSIDVAKVAIGFSNRINLKDNYEWNKLIASNYEKLADEAKSRNDDLMHLSYIEDALGTYEILKDEIKIKELKNKFIELKSKISLSKITTPIPKEMIDDSTETINKFLLKANSLDIINVLITTPMIRKLDELEKETKKMYSETPLTALMTKVVMDKMGNTIEEYRYDDKEALFHFNLLSLYNIEFQFVVGEIDYLLTQSIEKKLLNSDDVIEFLNNSWLGKDFERLYNGKIKSINLANTINYSIIRIFEELNNAILNKEYKINLMEIIDSLTLKFEYVFRFICEKLNVPTFYNKPGGANLKEEKTINSLLEDENLNENFTKGGLENDLFLFKFIFIEKIGWNLRNKIAHALLDLDEYSYQHAIILLVIFLKIASYNFKTIEDNVDPETSSG